MRQGARNPGAPAIQTPDTQEPTSRARSRATALLMRSMLAVLVWALLLLPVGLAPIQVYDGHGKSTVLIDGGSLLALSNTDRSQSALRSAESKAPSKAPGHDGYAAIGGGPRLPVPSAGRRLLARPGDAVAVTAVFSAFSARAPPAQV